MGLMDGPGLAGHSIAAVFITRAASNFQNPNFDGTAWLQLIILIVALILCGIASASETAFTSVSRIKLKNQVEEGDKKAIQIDRLLSQPNTYLSPLLIVNRGAAVVASSMATFLAPPCSTSLAAL